MIVRLLVSALTTRCEGEVHLQLSYDAYRVKNIWLTYHFCV